MQNKFACIMQEKQDLQRFAWPVSKYTRSNNAISTYANWDTKLKLLDKCLKVFFFFLIMHIYYEIICNTYSYGSQRYTMSDRLPKIHFVQYFISDIHGLYIHNIYVLHSVRWSKLTGIKKVFKGSKVAHKGITKIKGKENREKWLNCHSLWMPGIHDI